MAWQEPDQPVLQPWVIRLPSVDTSGQEEQEPRTGKRSEYLRCLLCYKKGKDCTGNDLHDLKFWDTAHAQGKNCKKKHLDLKELKRVMDRAIEYRMLYPEIDSNYALHIWFREPLDLQPEEGDDHGQHRLNQARRIIKDLPGIWAPTTADAQNEDDTLEVARQKRILDILKKTPGQLIEEPRLFPQQALPDGIDS